jgi:hypothetical protein
MPSLDDRWLEALWEERPPGKEAIRSVTALVSTVWMIYGAIPRDHEVGAALGRAVIRAADDFCTRYQAEHPEWTAARHPSD